MFVRSSKRFDGLERRMGRTEENVARLSAEVKNVNEGVKYLVQKSDNQPKPITWPMLLGILTLIFSVGFGVIKAIPVIASLLSV